MGRMVKPAPRNLRGGEMEDADFGGTTARPARPPCRCALFFIDNRLRRAPAAFNDPDDLEITRKIERGAVGLPNQWQTRPRARRADPVCRQRQRRRLAALVSQGRVSALIHARPQERRQLG